MYQRQTEQYITNTTSSISHLLAFHRTILSLTSIATLSFAYQLIMKLVNCHIAVPTDFNLYTQSRPQIIGTEVQMKGFMNLHKTNYTLSHRFLSYQSLPFPLHQCCFILYIVGGICRNAYYGKWQNNFNIERGGGGGLEIVVFFTCCPSVFGHYCSRSGAGCTKPR